MEIKQSLTPVNFTKKSSRKILALVLHSMWGTHQGSISWFKNPDAQASAHYCISQDGEIVQTVQDKDIAWHAGIFDEPIADWLKPNPNNVTIGIEIEDRRDPHWSYPEAQRRALIELVDHLCRKHNIPKDTQHIILHKNLNPSRRSDPVGTFDINWVLDAPAPIATLPTWLTSLAHERGIPLDNLEGWFREVLDKARDGYELALVRTELDKASKDLRQATLDLEHKAARLKEMELLATNLETQVKELNEGRNRFIDKLWEKLKPESVDKNEATILGEIDTLISTEDDCTDVKKQLKDANDEIAVLESDLRQCQQGQIDYSSISLRDAIVAFLMRWRK